HFPVKEAVLAEWMHACLTGDLALLMEAMMAHGSFASRVALLLEASARWWEEHRQYAAPYIRFCFGEIREGGSGQTSSEMITVYAVLITQAQKAGEIRNDQPAERLANYLHFLYLYGLLAWLEDAEVSLRDEFAHALEFFAEGAADR
ncbi:MAG: TetR/AcrR family transcriptional regulator, partial [Betaproteobacteria bacterium]|nr:TetR/AcrR family transcriptional regulator [Betaproteobacteria bacterium]